MEIGQYRRWWHEEGIAALGIYLSPGIPTAQAVSALRSAPTESIAALVLIALGLPLYPLFRRRRSQAVPPVISTPEAPSRYRLGR